MTSVLVLTKSLLTFSSVWGGGRVAAAEHYLAVSMLTPSRRVCVERG